MDRSTMAALACQAQRAPRRICRLITISVDQRNTFEPKQADEDKVGGRPMSASLGEAKVITPTCSRSGAV